MAVLRTVNFLSQQRVDVSDMRTIESAVRNDFDQLIQSFVTSPNQGYVLKGFEILMAGAIGGAASGLQLFVDGSTIFHVKSNLSGTFYAVPQGTLPQGLNSAINPQVDGAFVPNSINYIGLEYERFIDPATAAQVYLWNPTSNTESTTNSPRAQILRYRIKITTTSFASNVLPIATVTTDSGNNVTSVTDARYLLFRLGTGGASPDPYHKYPWNAQVEGRTENPPTSTTSASPFRGGDKMLYTLKDWMDAVMTSIAEIKGSEFWYSSGSSVSNISLNSLFSDAAFSVMTGSGRFKQPSAGLLQWTSPLDITEMAGQRIYEIDANPSGITVQDGQVVYISLERDEDFQPANSFTTTSGSYTISATTTVVGLSSGDYVKIASHPDSAWREVLSVAGNIITLVASPAPSYPISAAATKLLRSKGTYTLSDVIVANRENVPASGDTYWIAYRKDGPTFNLTIDTPINSGATRTNGVATFTFTSGFPFIEGQLVSISGVSDSTFDGIFRIINVVSSTQIKVQNEGPDVASGTVGNGTATQAAQIYLRWLGELSEGEVIQIDGQISADTLEYIGAVSETDSQPQYSSQRYVTNGDNLTRAIGKIDLALYDADFTEYGRILANLGNTRVRITSFDKTTSDGTTWEKSLNNLLVSFSGAQIDFSTGTVYASDGVTVIGNSFTPATITANQYLWYSVTAIQGAVNGQNESTLLFQVIPASASGATPSLAPRAPFSTGIQLGEVCVQDNGSGGVGTIKNIVQSNIVQIEFGGGSGPAGLTPVTFFDPVSTVLPTGATVTIDGIAGQNKDLVLFGNLSSGNNEVYELNGVGTSITWTPQVLFNGSINPSNADQVIVKKGNGFADQVGTFNGSNWLFNYTVRYFNGADYWEQSAIHTSSLADNSTGDVFNVNVSSSENWIISYSIQRGATKETGLLSLTSDDINADVSKVASYIGDAGTTFTATVVSGVLHLVYTTTSTGSAATMKYFYQRWSNMAGGPAGIPNYTGGGGGGGGSVTSVALSLPGIFSVSGSPVTSSGTLTATLNPQAANTFFSGPVTGAASAPTFRSIDPIDVPNLDASKITTGILPTTHGGTNLNSPGPVGNLLTSDGTNWISAPASGGGSSAGSNGDIQYSDGSGNFLANADLHWDNTADELQLNGLRIGILNGPFTLLDNQSSPQTIATYVAATYQFVIMEYSIVRNGNIFVGTAWIANNGTTASIAIQGNAAFGDAGITLDASLDLSGNLLLTYTSTSTTFNGAMKYSIRGWN
jgi:hypothetical protein